MVSEDKNLIKAGLTSAAIHSLVVAFGFLDVFEPQVYEDMFVNVEIAGASEMHQAVEDYDKSSVIEKPQPEPKSNHAEELKSEPKQEIPEEQLVKGPSIVEPEPVSEIDDQPQEKGEALSLELKNEEALRLEKEIAEKERQEKLRKEKEEKRRLEEKLKKEKKKKEAERRRKKRLEAIKKLEKRKKAKKRRLAKIADVVKKNEESKKKDAFSQMLNSERKTWNRSSNGSGIGHGNGLGSYGDGMGFVNSDAAIVSNQIIPHWVVAGGVKDAETLIIRVRIKVKDNGEVPASSIEILDKDRYNSDSVFRSAADSAKRAILKASPLRIPADKMHLFRDFEINFNTDKALGVNR